MSALTVVQQIVSVARHSPAMARDSACISGLLLFLDNPDHAVVLTALNALKILSEYKENQEYMSKIYGLVSSVKQVLRKQLSSEISKEAEAVLTHLNVTLTAADTQPQPLTPQRPHTSSGTPTATPATHSMFQSKLMKNARTITIQVNNMNDAKARQEVEQILIRVKGVVSFTFDTKTARVIVRARTELLPETICSAIAESNTMTAAQVVRNEAGQDVVVEVTKTPSAAPADTAARKPSYLDDQHEDTAPKPDKAVARKDDASFGTSSWISSVGGYLARSLYW